MNIISDFNNTKCYNINKGYLKTSKIDKIWVFQEVQWEKYKSQICKTIYDQKGTALIYILKYREQKNNKN